MRRLVLGVIVSISLGLAGDASAQGTAAACAAIGGGVAGARHYHPKLDLAGLPRLDLSVHTPGREADIGFVRRLDPALTQVTDPAAPAVVVLHFVRHQEALFAASASGLPWADPLECFFDLHEAGPAGSGFGAAGGPHATGERVTLLSPRAVLARVARQVPEEAAPTWTTGAAR